MAEQKGIFAGGKGGGDKRNRPEAGQSGEKFARKWKVRPEAAAPVWEDRKGCEGPWDGGKGGQRGEPFAYHEGIKKQTV